MPIRSIVMDFFPTNGTHLFKSTENRLTFRNRIIKGFGEPIRYCSYLSLNRLIYAAHTDLPPTEWCFLSVAFKFSLQYDNGLSQSI